MSFLARSTPMSTSHPSPDSLVSGMRLLRSLGLWLLASIIIGTATLFATRRLGVIDATPIVVAEVYALLIATLAFVFRPRAALGLVRCRIADVGRQSPRGGVPVTAALQSAGGRGLGRVQSRS